MSFKLFYTKWAHSLNRTATGIVLAGATLNGIVDANNTIPTVIFDMGNTSYGRTLTSDQSPVNGYDPTPVFAYISGLSPFTVYHFRVVAQNSIGTNYGNDMEFKTAAESPIPTISETGVIILGIMLMFIGLASLRKREQA